MCSFAGLSFSSQDSRIDFETQESDHPPEELAHTPHPARAVLCGTPTRPL